MIPKGQKDLQLCSFGWLQLNDLVLLGLCAKGIDNVPELVAASGIEQRTVYRRVSVLTGATKYVADKGIKNGMVPLVASRPHPHQAGKQLVLTGIGRKLLQGVHKQTAEE